MQVTATKPHTLAQAIPALRIARGIAMTWTPAQKLGHSGVTLIVLIIAQYALPLIPGTATVLMPALELGENGAMALQPQQQVEQHHQLIPMAGALTKKEPARITLVARQMFTIALTLQNVLVLGDNGVNQAGEAVIVQTLAPLAIRTAFGAAIARKNVLEQEATGVLLAQTMAIASPIPARFVATII